MGGGPATQGLREWKSSAAARLFQKGKNKQNFCKKPRSGLKRPMFSCSEDIEIFLRMVAVVTRRHFQTAKAMPAAKVVRRTLAWRAGGDLTSQCSPRNTNILERCLVLLFLLCTSHSFPGMRP